MVAEGGVLPLPWLGDTLRSVLDTRHAHALLVHGPQGVGQFELSVTLAQAWLCEATDLVKRPCGACASCRLVLAHAHPDMLVLLPDALREPLGWAPPGGEGDEASENKAGKAKPSKEIKVDAVRKAIEFAQTTSARGRCKVVVIHPAERMNGVAANALLKTLEEPAGVARFVLSGAAPDALLPTIRSRCQGVPMALPPTTVAVGWLAERGVADAAVLLAATGGQPQEALEWSAQGLDAALWQRVPALVQRGEAGTFAAWPLPRLVDALQKLCHDAACVAAGAAPRYFPATSLPPAADPAALTAWSAELMRVARHAEHPWSATLLVESLVQQGRRALRPTAREGGPGESHRAAGVSVHSRQ